MSDFNYGYERNKLEDRWDILRVEYACAGMSAEAMDAMYRYDLDELNSDRRYVNHTTDTNGLDDAFEMTGECIRAFSYLDTYNFDNPRYRWLDEITNPVLYDTLHRLDLELIDLLTMHVFERYSKTEIAQIKGMTKMSVSRRFKKIENILGKALQKALLTAY